MKKLLKIIFKIVLVIFIILLVLEILFAAIRIIAPTGEIAQYIDHIIEVIISPFTR